ncbi:hypothetical protein BOX15_Mlig017989g1 [Macrostomum lignano]|uniref:Sodium/calcium exchanger membrane region domain-containing protein n=1 Tax=Macrostomum lignano TaxID=282301 RepID=A0A267FHN9_9PLAT|nr:hypothetical protein BOX15_Mlig017989g1 [Macrostomum lignano]
MVRLFRAAIRKGQWNRTLDYANYVGRPHPLLASAVSLSLLLAAGLCGGALRGILTAPPDLTAWPASGELGRRLLSVSSGSDANKTYYNGKCELLKHAPKAAVSLEHCDSEQATGYQPAFIVLYIFLTIVTFIAVAIVCDDFFVPSLEVISEKLKLSEDVAGATFMAAGSSAPELFSSMSAVAMDSDAGVGTIAGSAVFNILIIVSFSAAFTGKVLKLDWRPLARDSFWYLTSVIYFIFMVMDSLTQIWEAVILLILYAMYIVTMVFNKKLMLKLAEFEDRFCSGGPKVEPVELEAQMQPVAAAPGEGAGGPGSSPDLARDQVARASNSSLRSSQREQRVFRHDRRNSLQLSGSRQSLRGVGDSSRRKSIVPSPDSAAPLPLTFESPAAETDSALQGQPDSGVPSTCHNSAASLSESDLRNLRAESNEHPMAGTNDGVDSAAARSPPVQLGHIDPIQEEASENRSVAAGSSAGLVVVEVDKPEAKDEEADEVARMSCCCACCPDMRGAPPQRSDAMSCGDWLLYALKWIVFVLAFPFIVAYSLTIPDCSRPHLKKYFLVSFFISVLWIAGVSFAMVTVVGRLGCLLGIDTFVMAITVLAAGTSIPDLLSSIIVARDGFADMAVSNAIGSNVFDIDIGLGLPFFVRLLINKAEPLDVFSQDERRDYCENKMRMMVHVKFGLILIIVLAITLGILGAARLKIGKKVATILILLYLVFLAYAFLQQFACRNIC